MSELYATEEWRTVPSYPAVQASSLGRFRLADGPNLPDKPGSHGYPMVYVPGFKNPRYAHVLVAEAFIGPRPLKADVDHINRIKADNRASNLRYCSRSENTKNAHRVGCGKGGRVIPVDQIPIIDAMNRDGITMLEIAKMYGVLHSSISKILKKYRAGYSFRRERAKLPPPPKTPLMWHI